MKPIILKDGTYLYDEEAILDYLFSLGFDKFDIEELLTTKNDEIQSLQTELEEAERCIDSYYIALNSFSMDVLDICQNLRDGKGTKAKIADELERLVNFYTG